MNGLYDLSAFDTAFSSKGSKQLEPQQTAKTSESINSKPKIQVWQTNFYAKVG
jgi:hypothetical protein